MIKRVLVVEDDIFLATDLAEQLEQNGFDVVGPFLNSQDALSAFGVEALDAAVLDINLGHETSEPVAQTLKQSNIPFVVVSGYLDSQTPKIFDGVPAFSKPVIVDRLVSFLRAAG